MSDEPSRAAETPRQTPAGIWEHLCEHPDGREWGGGGSPGGEPKTTIWFCTEHKPE